MASPWDAPARSTARGAPADALCSRLFPASENTGKVTKTEDTYSNLIFSNFYDMRHKHSNLCPQPNYRQGWKSVKSNTCWRPVFPVEEVALWVYLVWVGISRTQESLVLVKQHPELTIKLRLVQQLTQHWTTWGNLSTLGLRTQQNKVIHTDTQKQRFLPVCARWWCWQYLVEAVGEDNLVELSVVRENIPHSQGFYLRI